MGLRERARIGELERHNVQLRERVGALEQEIATLHADPSQINDALARENDRLSRSLLTARSTIEQLRAALKHANEAGATLAAELRAAANGRQPEPDRSLAVLQTTEGISPAARTHLLELYGAAGQDYFPKEMRAALAALVAAYRHHWTPPPGTCDELAKALRVTAYGFFSWLRRRSPLISVHGRDAKKRIIYSLHLEHLGSDELPVVTTLPPWLNVDGNFRT